MSRRRPNGPFRKRQQGVALVVVLWILLLVTISTCAYTLMARMDQLEAHTVLAGTRARLAAEAGMNLAVLSLRDPDETQRIVPDGRVYQVSFQDALVEVRVIDERGKLDINTATEDTLVQLFNNNGVEDADLMAAAIHDWIDQDDIEREGGAEIGTYESMGLSIGPGNRRFILVEELLQVVGVSYDLYKKIEPALSVYSEQGEPDPAFAPKEALLALPEMTEEEALNFIQQRESDDAESGVGPTLPNGQVAMARGRGLTYSIVAKATLPNGVWDQIEATIRLGASPQGIPFRILRWREGFHH